MAHKGERDLLPHRAEHHRNMDPKTKAIVIPARLGWWAQLQRERMCRRMHGHCFHGHLYMFWNCCMCGQVEEGIPVHGCHYCMEEYR